MVYCGGNLKRYKIEIIGVYYKIQPKINYKKLPAEKRLKIAKGEDVFPVRFNIEDREMLDKAKQILCVNRDSTALKELAYLGFDVLHSNNLGRLIPRIISRIKKGYHDLL